MHRRRVVVVVVTQLVLRLGVVVVVVVVVVARELEARNVGHGDVVQIARSVADRVVGDYSPLLARVAFLQIISHPPAQQRRTKTDANN